MLRASVRKCRDERSHASLPAAAHAHGAASAPERSLRRRSTRSRGTHPGHFARIIQTRPVAAPAINTGRHDS